MTQDLQAADARIARLETSVHGLEEQVRGVASSLDRFAAEVREARKPPWQLLLGMGAIVMTTIGMASGLILFVGTLLLAPVQISQAEDGSRLERHQVRLDEMRSQVDRMVVQFTEVETQFRALSNYRNLTDAHQDQLLALLWGRTYQEPLPGNGERPTVGR